MGLFLKDNFTMVFVFLIYQDIFSLFVDRKNFDYSFQEFRCKILRVFFENNYSILDLNNVLPHKAGIL